MWNEKKEGYIENECCMRHSEVQENLEETFYLLLKTVGNIS